MLLKVALTRAKPGGRGVIYFPLSVVVEKPID
jgi:hypothetical protein